MHLSHHWFHLIENENVDWITDLNPRGFRSKRRKGKKKILPPVVRLNKKRSGKCLISTT